jgi:hypothetical protein
MKTFEQFINHKIYYRGAKTNELGKSSFDGMWCSSDYNVAAQYGKVWKYKIENANLLDTNDEKARTMEKIFEVGFPGEDEYYNQDGDWTELWAFPPKGIIRILRDQGYDGYNNGMDTFIFNLHKVKPLD